MKKPSSSPSTSGRLTKAALLSLALGSQACTTAQMVPAHEASKVTNVASAKASARPKTQDETPQPAKSEEELSNNAQVIRMLIMGKAPKAWPGVPAKCVYTGIVLEHDTVNEPHKVLLENMCIQHRERARNVFEGNHLTVEMDQTGRYPLPFYDAYLEEKPDGLHFVTEQPGQKKTDDVLEPGSYEANTLSFERFLDDYKVRALGD